jgi:hypothetical protein
MNKEHLNNIFRLLTILLFISTFFSCKEEIEIELNNQENQRIVVEGRITNELKHHQIRLSRTLSYFDSSLAPPVLDAGAYILEESTGSHFSLTLVNSVMGYYQTDLVQGTIGENYILVVDDGSDEYQAATYLDNIAQLDSINYQYEYQSFFGMGQGYYKIRISAFEPPPLGNVYMFNVYMNDTLKNATLAETPYQSDQFFNDSYIANVDIMYIPQEEVFNDTNYVLVEMLSISQDEYEYNTTFIQETYNNGSIFSGPPANIPSNFKNISGGLDGLGFFGASAIVRKEMIMYKEHNDSTNNTDGYYKVLNP